MSDEPKANNELIKMDKSRRMAIGVIAYFEELLADNDITIPSGDREGEPDEARIYGSVYYDLEDKITNYLHKKGVRDE
jgi:hypothetical protein